MNRKRYLLAAAVTMVFAGALLLPGCSEDGNEWQRLVCEVQSINDGAALVSGYLDAGQDKIAGTEDDTFPVDIVEVTFHARPYNSAITLPEDAPYSYFHVTSYDLIWHPLTPGGETLPEYNITGGGTDALVPVNERGSCAVLVADRYLKDQPWFVSQLATGLPFTARCELRFRGHETGSDREVTVSGSFLVHFVYAIVRN